MKRRDGLWAALALIGVGLPLATGCGGISSGTSADPCIGVTCDSPPSATCEDESTLTTYAATGTCDAGSCSYEPTDTACTGGTPKCTDLGTTPQCVAACLADANCNGATPFCNTSTNTCGTARPSCTGLTATCGQSGTDDCCASSVVTGGTFYRSYDGARYPDQSYPATVSNFRLDTYEITVGRFRKFVAAYSQNMIASGAGANPNNAADTGWNPAWNASLPADAEALTARATTRAAR